MNPEVLERVLSCRSLPTLPAVALRVVELTNSENVTVRDLAQTIQNDMALSAKILKTVNSSLFGLRTPCSNINQAIALLGLSTVKTLALSFSLVTAIKSASPDTLDMEDHWRRALYTSTAARQIALRTKIPGADEAFLGGLLQDLGVIALSQSLGKPYIDLVKGAAGDHRKLVKLEIDALQTQHADIGAMLAMRWKLPPQLVMPIKYHERAAAAPLEFNGVCRAVGLGNLAADVLTVQEPAPVLRRFYQRAEQWFALSSLQADDILKTITTQVRDVASLLKVQSGPSTDAESIIAIARERMSTIVISIPDADSSLEPGTDPPGCDELTGIACRMDLEHALVGAFEQANRGLGALSLAIFDIDGFESITDQCGPDAADTVLIAIAHRLESAFKPTGALVSRYGPTRFGVAMPRTDRATAVRRCELIRRDICEKPITLFATKPGAPSFVDITCSVGLATLDERTNDRLDSVSALTSVTEQAVSAARRAGPGSIRVFAPATSAAA